MVVACEVLYYFSDVPLALRRLSSLGRNVLVSYYDREMPRLGEQVRAHAAARDEIISFDDGSGLPKRWQLAWWTSGAP
ncbi:MAG: hypothetical protein FJY37_15965 [Betaproteobacteria bacterium]|nr:hypothetical protein [Betaproteobacteria bacterium]